MTALPPCASCTAPWSGRRVMERELLLLRPGRWFLGAGLAVTSGAGPGCLLYRTATSAIQKQTAGAISASDMLSVEMSSFKKTQFSSILFLIAFSFQLSLQGLRCRCPEPVLCPPRPPHRPAQRVAPPRPPGTSQSARGHRRPRRSAAGRGHGGAEFTAGLSASVLCDGTDARVRLTVIQRRPRPAPRPGERTTLGLEALGRCF